MSARITLSFSLVWFVAALLPAPAQKTLKAFNPNLMDTTVDPCENFFQYSCGGYLKQTPIPADESSYGQSDELNDENQLVLKAILEKAAAGGTLEVADNIERVAKDARETGTTSGLMLKSAKELSEVSSHLKVEVEKFLDSVRAA